MSKKDYIDAINELKVDDKFKKETINKIKMGGKSMKKKPHIYALAVVMLVIVISAALQANIDRDNIYDLDTAGERLSLPTVNSFDNLYSLLKLEKTDGIKEFATKSEAQGINLEDGGMRNAMVATEESAINADTVAGTGDYSKTNIQVANVDEGDIVKTDGRYLYYISNPKVVIIDAENPEEMKIVNEIEYDPNEFYPSELYVNDDVLVVIGGVVSYRTMKSSIEATEDRAISQNHSEFVIAKVYDISNKEDAKLEREIQIEGSYLTSRMIGENIYFLANKYIYTYYIEKEELDENEFKPQYRDSVTGNELKCLEFPDIYYFPDSEEKNYLNIASFNINSDNEANISSYLGAGNCVYVSENNLYVTNTKYEYEQTEEATKVDEEYKTLQFIMPENHKITTNIYKFGLDNGNVDYSAVGTVPGQPLNQFSMDESDSNFRIAVTDSTSWNQETNVNNLYVLNDKLEIIGSLEGLAEGERIYSVRFIGERAYMVTFVQVDPLFVIDLSKPESPVVLGELKVPGYSNYLHPYDENHLIGFGEDAETNKDGRTLSTGMKMALFNVSDPNNPKELYSEKIGERGTHSEILYNHKSLLFSKEKNIIAFPITITEETSNYNNNLKFSGAIIYGLDLDKGFYLKGTIADQEIINGYRDYDYYKVIERIVYIKDTLFTLSKKLVKSVDMQTTKEKGQIEIELSESRYMNNIMPLEEVLVEPTQPADDVREVEPYMPSDVRQ